MSMKPAFFQPASCSSSENGEPKLRKSVFEEEYGDDRRF
jgi:hypothetical protein